MKNVNFSGLKLSTVQPGQKVSNATKPELFTTPTVNKFGLNSLATSKMNVKLGDFVLLQEDESSEDINTRFYICVTDNSNAAKLTSATKSQGVGRNLTFSYAGIWGKMLIGKADAPHVQPSALVEEGLVEKRTIEKTKRDGTVVVDKNGEPVMVDTYSALKKVFFEIADPFEYEMEDGTTIDMYPLTNMRTEDYVPKDFGTNEDED